MMVTSVGASAGPTLGFYVEPSSAAGAAKRLSFHELVCHLPVLSGIVRYWHLADVVSVSPHVRS